MKVRAFGFLVSFYAAATVAASAADWSHWRGPTQNGVAADRDLPASWSQTGKNLRWHAPYGGRTAPIVLGGRVYMIGRAGETPLDTQERIVCLDLKTGDRLWEHRLNVFDTDIVAHRIGWANLAGDPETGNVYAHAVSGEFLCFNPQGRIVWRWSLTEEFGRVSGYGGRLMFPVVDGDQVILSFLSSSWGPQARPVYRYYGFDKRTGEILWSSEPSGPPIDTVYSGAALATLDGVRVLFDTLGDGAVHCLKANTGEPIWHFPLSKGGLNTSPVYADGRLYVTHSEENLDSPAMGAVVCLNARGSGKLGPEAVLWRVDGIPAGYASPTLHEGLLYVPDNTAHLHCFDAATGEKLWVFKYGSTGAKGSGVLADGKMYIGETGGTYHILKVSRAGAELLHSESFRTPAGLPIEIYGTPAVVDGAVLLTTLDDMYAIALPDARPVAAPAAPAPVAPAPVDAEKPGAPAHLQVVPAEISMQAGARVAYRARLFDEKGRFIGETKADWSLKGLAGAIDAGGVYRSADDSKRLEAGTVQARVGELTGSARLRVAPALPYRVDFEDMAEGSVPAGWLTSTVRMQVTAMDGNNVLRKLANNPAPPFARARAYILPVIDTGYTIAADMMGQSKRTRFAPEMGLMNSRYRLILVGTGRTRVLRLVTWDALPRLQKDLPWDWKTETWYSTKLRVEVVGDKALVRGKVWPQGQPEPEAWTVEMEDPYPNLAGAPGLYAYSVAITATSPGTEVYFDNVEVSRP
jgi:outer membrane protein assembly factor BamB